MSNINQNVNINVNANTQDASQDISRLENNIKTLDGAINLVGGSIEVLAGSLALTGAVTEEQAERFEAAAVGAIALADGSKRALEGFKILATETKVFTGIQRVLNTVLRANPIFLLAGAIAAVTAAYVAFRASQRDTKDTIKETNDELDRQVQLLKETERVNQSGAEQLEKFRKEAERTGKTIDEVIAEEKARIDAAEERARKVASIESDADRERRELLLQNFKETRELILEAEELLGEERAKIEEKLQKEREEREKKRRAKEISDEQAAFEEFERQYNKRKKLEDDEFARRLAYDRERYKSAIQTAQGINQTEQKILDARLEIGQIGVDAFQESLNAIFGESKGLAKAQVLIDAAQAAVGIIRKGTDPRNAEALVFPNAWIAANLGFLAATTATSLQAINSANANGGGAGGTNYGAPNTGRGGGLSGPGFNLGAPTITGDASGVTALQAIVLAGDVTSAQAQEAAIRNRRRFG
jgi:hypothetical protein